MKGNILQLSLLILISLTTAESLNLITIHANQKIRISETIGKVHRFNYEGGHDTDGESYLYLDDPTWKGKLFQRKTNQTQIFDGKGNNEIILEKGEFILAPAEDQVDNGKTLSFTILQKKLAATPSVPIQTPANQTFASKTACSDFEGPEDCANDSKFCRSKCHLLVCSTTRSALLNKSAPDSTAISLCGTTNLTPAIRYDLDLTHEQVPALIIFMLTVLSGLLAIFVILVLHYNCMVSF